MHDDAGAAGRSGLNGPGEGHERRDERAPRIDALAAVPDGLIADLGARRTHGIRITLAARDGPPAFPLGLEQVSYTRFARRLQVAEPAYHTYGEGWAAADPSARPDDAVRSLEFAIVDVETTGGFAAGGHRITEVAAVRLRGDGAFVDEYATLVNPQRPIPPFITRLTRITHSMTERAPRFRDVAENVHRILDGAVFVAHNASFDWRFLSTELEWATGRGLRGRVLCTVRLARRIVPELSHRSLDALAWYFGVENVARHRAFGDARATAEVFRMLLDRLDEMEIHGWEALERLLSRRAKRRKRRASPEPVKDP
ncbi:MAG: 3'-5' exonuclease [Gemmatimonadetes bacterium]|nr:3'-5' exonuclease [Gemmatimonadota bacterium]